MKNSLFRWTLKGALKIIETENTFKMSMTQFFPSLSHSLSVDSIIFHKQISNRRRHRSRCFCQAKIVR
jgi:hypothetical protein